MIHLEKREERDNGQGRHSKLSIETQMCVHMCIGICFLGRSYCLWRSPEANKGPYVGVWWWSKCSVSASNGGKEIGSFNPTSATHLPNYSISLRLFYSMIPSLLKRHFIKRHLHMNPLVPGVCFILLELLIGKRRKVTIFFPQCLAPPPIFTSQIAENRTRSLGEVPVVWKGYYTEVKVQGMR